jgi:hypothetical protein
MIVMTPPVAASPWNTYVSVPVRPSTSPVKLPVPRCRIVPLARISDW